MDPITLFILFGTIWLGTQSFFNDALKVQEEAKQLRDDAQEQADLARKQARVALKEDVGQLAFKFDTYEDWYAAQQGEYATAVAGGYGGSWQDYLQSQQTTELGEYGRGRAQLESDVSYAEEQLAQARSDAQAQYEFGLREHEAGVTQSNRALRSEAQMAAATGFRSGTPYGTVAENDRVRQETLQLYLDQITQANQSNLAATDRSERQLASNFDLSLSGLDAALAGARGGYDLNIEGIGLDFSQYSDQLSREVASAQGLGSYFEHLIGAGQTTLSVFKTGIDVGAWGYSEAGQFWAIWDRPNVAGVPSLETDFAIPSLSRGIG